MKTKSISASFILLLLINTLNTLWALPPAEEAINWSEFLAEQDMHWKKLPNKWNNGPFLGNGEQGTLMYQLDKRTLRWDVGCSAAHDHRPMDQDDLSEKNVVTLNRGRLYIGHLRLELPADLTDGKSRLSLWDAEATGTLSSAGGTAKWGTLVHATEPVMRFELAAEGDLKGAKFTYMAEEARNSRAIRSKNPRKPANPSPVISTLDDGVRTAVHNLHAGGQTAVAWLQKDVGGVKRLWLSVQHSFPDKKAVDKAVAAVRSAAAADQTAWVQAHRKWWHSYYPSSFVATGDAFWDSFYWVQQYKLACATRDKGWIIDNQGPWLQPTAWNSLWWNLNVQLSHSGVYTANRRGMGSALSHSLDINRDNLARNVAEPYRADSYAIGRNSSAWDLLGHAGEPNGRKGIKDAKIGKETGNLLWAMHNVDLEYRYWQDRDLRDRVLYPLLTRAVNYYRHFLVKDDDGLLSLPKTFSPEYKIAADCTYDMELLRWGAGRLIELAAEKGLTQKDEPLISEWTKIQRELVPRHVDEKTGIMVGRNVKFNSPHRHWSHLLAIYPLRTLTPESAADRELIEQSLSHWHSFGKRVAGYAHTGGACMSALLGDGERAFGFLNTFKTYLKPNTFYSEGQSFPVMETPLHGATAMQEMLLQSWNNRLRVFPAVPKEWTDIQIHQLRGEGGFLVSARREQLKTQWVLVQAESGGSVEVQPQLANAQWATSDGVSVSKGSNGIYSIKTSPGDWVLFWPAGKPRPEAKITPVPRRGKEYHFGL